MIYLAASAIVFWFVVLPILKMTMNIGFAALTVIDEFRKTEMTDEEHQELRKQVQQLRDRSENQIKA